MGQWAILLEEIFAPSSTTMNEWWRDFLWRQTSQVSQSYRSCLKSWLSGGTKWSRVRQGGGTNDQYYCKGSLYMYNTIIGFMSTESLYRGRMQPCSLDNWLHHGKLDNGGKWWAWEDFLIIRIKQLIRLFVDMNIEIEQLKKTRVKNK